MTKVPVAADAAQKSYYKYYEQGIENLTAEQLAEVAASKGRTEDALEACDRAKLLEPGVWPEKSGYYPLKNGGMLVAANIPMPDVTADMLYWWFAWHGLDPLRYAIWDCEDHFDVKLSDVGRARALDPGVPMEQKTWGATHTVMESMGGPASEIVLMFQNPADMGYDVGKIGTENCEFMVCCNGFMGEMKIPASMTECAKRVNGVMTFMARFWIGYHCTADGAKYLLPPEVQIPEEIAVGLEAHSIKEFSNLAKILPSVYAEEKDRW